MIEWLKVFGGVAVVVWLVCYAMNHLPRWIGYQVDFLRWRRERRRIAR